MKVEIQGLRLAELVERCAEQSRHFSRGREHDDRFCFELFRRAIVVSDQAAWEAIHAQYHVLVRDWIWQHSLASSIDDHESLLNRVFERFWQAIQPQKFEGFPHLAALLRYLKLCTFAALVDEARVQRGWENRRAAAELADEVEGERVDEVVLDELGRSAVWQTIEGLLTDSAERQVIYLSVVIGLKPREITKRHNRLFPTVDEVYRVKRLAMDRLRRDPRLRELWVEGP